MEVRAAGLGPTKGRAEFVLSEGCCPGHSSSNKEKSWDTSSKTMSLLLHEVVHLIVGVVLGFVVMQTTRKSLVLPWAILTSLLIDIDHIVDYLGPTVPR